jgi:hypothetical protein
LVIRFGIYLSRFRASRQYKPLSVANESLFVAISDFATKRPNQLGTVYGARPPQNSEGCARPNIATSECCGDTQERTETSADVAKSRPTGDHSLVISRQGVSRHLSGTKWATPTLPCCSSTARAKAFSETAFNSAWQRATRAAGFGKHELHFHDLMAKAVSDSPNFDDAMERGGHLDPRTTRRVYRREPIEVVPLPRVSKKAS